MKQNLAKLAILDGQYIYFMLEIIVSLANHDNPKKFVPNCGMWALSIDKAFVREYERV